MSLSPALAFFFFFFFSTPPPTHTQSYMSAPRQEHTTMSSG